MKYKPEKRKGGIVEGSAYANGKGGYIPMASKTTKGWARSKAAQSKMKGK